MQYVLFCNISVNFESLCLFNQQTLASIHASLWLTEWTVHKVYKFSCNKVKQLSRSTLWRNEVACLTSQVAQFWRVLHIICWIEPISVWKLRRALHNKVRRESCSTLLHVWHWPMKTSCCQAIYFT